MPALEVVACNHTTDELIFRKRAQLGGIGACDEEGRAGGELLGLPFVIGAALAGAISCWRRLDRRAGAKGMVDLNLIAFVS